MTEKPLHLSGLSLWALGPLSAHGSRYHYPVTIIWCFAVGWTSGKGEECNQDRSAQVFLEPATYSTAEKLKQTLKKLAVAGWSKSHFHHNPNNGEVKQYLSLNCCNFHPCQRISISLLIFSAKKCKWALPYSSVCFVQWAQFLPERPTVFPSSLCHTNLIYQSFFSTWRDL